MGRSVVVWGGPPYFGPANSIQEEMARAFRELGCEVLYLELEGDAEHFRRALSDSPGPAEGTALAPEGTVVARVPKVPFAPYALFGPSHWANMKLAAGQLERLAPVWRQGEPVMVNYGWFASQLVWGEPDARHVYDCIDDHTAAVGVEGRPGLEQRVLDGERDMLEGADLTTCLSRALASERKGIARRCVVLPNAVRAGMFEGEFAEPKALSGLPRPRALFIGTFGPKIDPGLVAEAARAAPEVAWVFAGDVRGVSVRRMPKNVKLLGETPHGDMPALAAHSDVGVAPLTPSNWNRASAPMKFCDYMAAGLPMVTRTIPAAEDLAADIEGGVFLAESPEDFARAVREAAAAGPEVRERCRAWAREHTWVARARDMLDLVDKRASRGPATGAGSAT
ncbi:MAG: glycosyltransferase [Planctomycetota bacterium]